MNMNLQHMGIKGRKILMRVYGEGPDAFGYAKYLRDAYRTFFQGGGGGGGNWVHISE